MSKFYEKLKISQFWGNFADISAGTPFYKTILGNPKDVFGHGSHKYYKSRLKRKNNYRNQNLTDQKQQNLYINYSPKIKVHDILMFLAKIKESDNKKNMYL
jgi:hypothetical protein